jgi:eukaryotic-like serine/threonine-protein kinase
VAYVSYPESILWKANRDGSNPVQPSDPPIQAFLPRWSPDGKQIVFSDISSLQHLTNYIVSSDGGSPRKLLPEDTNPQMFPFWSPDGHKIAFTWQPASEAWFTPKIEVRILDLDSHQVTRVPKSEGMLGPRWSTGGQGDDIDLAWNWER